MDRNPQDVPGRPGAGSEEAPARRFGATRVRPRIEVGRPKPATGTPGTTGAPLRPEVVESGAAGGGSYGPESDLTGGGAYGGERDPFAPRSLAGGRVRVYGCSPGCLIASLAVSLVLTLLLNALF